MDCKQVRALMLDELKGEVGGKLGGSFYQHIKGCQECKRIYNQLAEAYKLLESTPPLDINPDTYNRILERGKALLEKKSLPGKVLQVRLAVGTAVALAIFALALTFMKGDISSRQLAQHEEKKEIYAIEYVSPPPVELATYTF